MDISDSTDLELGEEEWGPQRLAWKRDKMGRER
jgi:hypothetical protein